VPSLDLFSKYQLIMDLRLDAMLYSNFAIKIMLRAIWNVNAGRIWPEDCRFPTPDVNEDFTDYFTIFLFPKCNCCVALFDGEEYRLSHDITTMGSGTFFKVGGHKCTLKTIEHFCG